MSVSRPIDVVVLNDCLIEADTTLPEAAAEALRLLGKEVDRLETRLAEIDKNLLAQHKADPDSRRLSAIPGVGPMSALSFSRMVDATQFKSGRQFAAWLGLVPREISPGGLAEPQVIDDFDRSARTKSFCSSDSGAEISFHDPVDSLHAIWSRLIKRNGSRGGAATGAVLTHRMRYGGYRSRQCGIKLPRHLSFRKDRPIR